MHKTTLILKGMGVSLFLMASAATASAHDFNYLQVSKVVRTSSDFWRIEINNTVKGRLIVCALYNKAGKLLASDTETTDNLATSALILYRGSDAASAKCVFND